MKAIILAAGYAVRLQPLTLNMPKPLLTVGGRAIIDRLLDKIGRINEIDHVHVISNGKFFSKFDEWAKKDGHKKKITVLNDGSTSDENKLGAIKDLALTISSNRVDDDVLIIAGDNLFDVELTKFIAFGKAHSDGVSIAVHDIKDRKTATNFGVVEVDGSEKVVSFEEKPKEPKSTLISTGIYYFPKNKLSLIENYVKMQNVLDAPGYYIGWLSREHKVYGFSFLEDWYDIGNIESYKKADREYIEKEKGKNV